MVNFSWHKRGPYIRNPVYLVARTQNVCNTAYIKSEQCGFHIHVYQKNISRGQLAQMVNFHGPIKWTPAALHKPTYAFLHKAAFEFQAVSNVTIVLPTMTETDNKEANRLCEDLEFLPYSPRPLCHPTMLWHVVWAPFPKKAKCAKLPRSLAKSLRNRYVTLLCLAWPKKWD